LLSTLYVVNSGGTNIIAVPLSTNSGGDVSPRPLPVIYAHVLDLLLQTE